MDWKVEDSAATGGAVKQTGAIRQPRQSLISVLSSVTAAGAARCRCHVDIVGPVLATMQVRNRAVIGRTSAVADN